MCTFANIFAQLFGPKIIIIPTAASIYKFYAFSRRRIKVIIHEISLTMASFWLKIAYALRAKSELRSSKFV